MKKQTRYKVFETNSSSCHSICVSFEDVAQHFSFKKQYEYDEWDFDEQDEDKYTIYLDFGKYGWGPEVVFGEIDKTRYLLTMVGMVEEFKSEEEFYQTEGFTAINEVIKQKTSYSNGIKINDGNFDFSHSWSRINGYIDHQSSTDDYKSLQEFCDENHTTIEEFIFNPEIFVMVDNDNY